MAFDKTAFIKDIMDGVAVDPAQKAAFEAALENPIVAKRLEESTLRQSDYSKKLDEYKQKVQGVTDYHAQLTRWQKEEQDRLEAERKQLKSRVPSDEDLEDPNNGLQQYLKAEDFDKKAQEFLLYTNAVNRITASHLKEFGEVVNLQDILDVAAKTGTNVSVAYDLYVKPKREEIQKAEFQKQLDEARKQGAEEYAKNLKLPTTESPFSSDQVHALDGLNKQVEGGPKYGALAAAEAWATARREGKLPLY